MVKLLIRTLDRLIWSVALVFALPGILVFWALDSALDRFEDLITWAYS